MGVLGLTPFLQKKCPEIIKQLPNRLQELAGKRVVIDGTLITQRLHYAPAPHPYRHVQGWFRLARELQEAGVSAVCVFDGKQRNIAKAREAERRKDLQRKAEARGALEIDRSKRLKQLSDVLPRFWGLNDALQKRTTDILRQLVPDLPPKRANRETLEDLPLRRQDILHVAPITPEILKPRLSMDVDFFIPEIVADEGIADDGLFVANHVDSLLQEVDATYVEDFADHPWFQEPTTPFYWEPFTLEPNEPDMYTNVSSESTDDLHPRLFESRKPSTLAPEQQSSESTPSEPVSSSALPTPSAIPKLSSSPEPQPADLAPIEPVSLPVAPTPVQQEDIPAQLSNLYIEYRQSVSRLASLSDPFDSSPTPIPAVGDPDTQAEIVMTKAQYRLTLEEGRFWDDFATETSGSKLPDTLEKLVRTSDLMSASFERRMNPPTAQTYTESKEILQAMGVPCLETLGAYEAEALASSLVLNGHADYVISEDTDVLVYEAPLVRNVTSRNEPLTLISGTDIRTSLQLDRDSFVDFALLLGTDFSQRIKNVGPTRALKFIREHGSIERVVELETKYVPPLAPQAYLAQVELARSVFRTLPPVPDAELLKQGDIDETTLVAVLQKYGLGKEVVDVVDWDYGAALRGNYFQDNPSAF